jgi:hypothetical protein
MDITGLGAVFNLGSKILDKIFPDKEAADRAKLELLKLQQSGELTELEKRFSAIVAEARSQDPWTSRARPSFMYVMYTMLLASIPMGFLFAFKPDVALAVTTGVTNWLHALPEEMWWLFGAGYLGYSGARTFEKVRK